LKKNDIILILSVVFIACVGYFFINSSLKKAEWAVIRYDGAEYARVSIDENREISVNGTNTVKIENGQVYVSWANCPDKLCMKQGKIENANKTLVCLPNRVTVEVEEKR